MVCAKCEKKLTKVACPEKWKEGSSNTVAAGGRKLNENKLLDKSKRLVLWSIGTCLVANPAGLA